MAALANTFRSQLNVSLNVSADGQLQSQGVYPSFGIYQSLPFVLIVVTVWMHQQQMMSPTFQSNILAMLAVIQKAVFSLYLPWAMIRMGIQYTCALKADFACVYTPRTGWIGYFHTVLHAGQYLTFDLTLIWV